MSIETFIRDQIRNRETRLRSPGFQAEMAREKAEFKDGLSNIGKSALDFVYTGIGKNILGGSINSAAKLAFNKKYGFDNLLKDGKKAALGTTRIGMKVVWNMAKSTGKLAKMGVRQLIAK